MVGSATRFCSFYFIQDKIVHEVFKMKVNFCFVLPAGMIHFRQAGFGIFALSFCQLFRFHLSIDPHFHQVC